MFKLTWSHEDGTVEYSEVTSPVEVGFVQDYIREVTTFRQVVKCEEIPEPEPEVVPVEEVTASPAPTEPAPPEASGDPTVEPPASPGV
jgi:hypothetical protein